jgi:mono/diheme cytochrome c family protein
MKKILIALTLALFIIACGSGDSATTESSSSSSTAASEPAIDGKQIYKSYCLACHGLYGDMGASGAFNLQTSEITMDERVEVITNGRNVMTPFKAILSPDEIQAVAEYSLELKID